MSTNDLIALLCPQCGGKVEVTPTTLEEEFFSKDDGQTYIYIGKSSGPALRCGHCGTEFLFRQRISVAFEGKGNLRIDTGGGAFVGGSIITKGGDFVGRDKVVIIKKQ